MLLSASTIFLGAFLLFQIQPLIAKMILPWFGGSAAVWITAMLFFQMVLLGGYLYAHWSVRSLAPRTQATFHLVLLAASFAVLPVLPSPSWRPAGNEDPLLRILGLLTISIGLPYFLLSSTSPLIQAWYARSRGASIPYRLFALSNLASLLGLLAYPFLVERLFTLKEQSWRWSAAYVLFAASCAGAAVRNGWPAEGQASGSDPGSAGDAGGPPATGERMTWLVLSGCASTLLLAVTNHLTQNVASIPFLWVLPLGLYLVTFILTFDFEGIYRRRPYLWVLAASLAAMAYGLTQWNSRTPLSVVIPVYSIGLFAVCMFCHGELVKRKPPPIYLTSFYLMLSAGGALGGILVGVIAPRVLPAYYELPLGLIAAAALMLSVLDYRRWRMTLAITWAVAAGVVLAAGFYVSSYTESARAMGRNFYGVLRVTESGKGTVEESRTMVHGTVIHGRQLVAPERRRELISYYGPDSGVALALRQLGSKRLRVGIIGLGAGSLAAFARPGDAYRFYEINALVELYARTEFTYLEECRGSVDVVLGDGRLALERETGSRYDLLVVDAFSGDAIPVHLMTRQALELYFSRLAPRGILALHITNSHLDLEPVVAALARELGKHAVIVRNDENTERMIYRSTWALLSPFPLTCADIIEAGEVPVVRPDIAAWTDDHNNLFQVMK